MSNIELSDEEKGIVRYLGKRGEKIITLDDIQKYLDSQQYKDNDEKFNIKEVRGMMNHLHDVGYSSSKTVQRGNDRKEAYYLAPAGRFRKRLSQNRGLEQDVMSWLRRVTGSVFLLMGLGLFAYEGPKLTGAVIGVHTSGFLVGALFVFVGLAFFFVKPKKKK
ncbi:MAG: hypothetical protein NTZ83_05155 [Candidatus Pacearchaeota archaeon]|nr:hypothetical protein [Candidatus Pacearchaeota archaeon]